jgi:peptidoglycan/LPS O-acetylase OafA/YrhL
MGMALFFTLSGFLITRFLAEGMELKTFLLRRLARILPLAWVVMLGLAIWNGPNVAQVMANFLFYANLPPAKLFHGGEHLWSICVEMQFYAFAALLCVIPHRKGLYLIPVFCLAVTTLRIVQGAQISIYTWQRVDEILVGGCIALIYMGWFGENLKRLLCHLTFWPSLLFLVVCSHPASGAFQYLRPYAAAALVAGSLMIAPPKRIEAALVSRPFAYLAEISYALYMIHGVLMNTWLGQGSLIERYIKKPFLFLLTFGLAHLSTRYFERPILRLVRRISQKNSTREPGL